MYIEKDFANINNIISFEELSVFFLPQYAKTFPPKMNPKMVWIVSDCFILPVIIFRKFCFQWATLSGNPYNYKDFGVIDNAYLDKVCSTLKKAGIQWITPTMAASPFSTYPTKSKRIPFGTYIVDLKQSEEVLMQNMHSKHRNVVRRAEKDGVKIKIGGKELLKDYIELENITWAKSGRASNGLAYYENIVDHMMGNIDISIAYFEDKPQSGAITYWSKVEAYYMFGANLDNPHIGSGNLLQWKLLLLYKKRNVARYNFVGCRINEDKNSKYHGIQRFKERFGGKLVEGYMFKTTLNPLCFSIWNFLYKILKHRSVSDAIDQEIHKWGDLNNA